MLVPGIKHPKHHAQMAYVHVYYHFAAINQSNIKQVIRQKLYNVKKM